MVLTSQLEYQRGQFERRLAELRSGEEHQQFEMENEIEFLNKQREVLVSEYMNLKKEHEKNLKKLKKYIVNNTESREQLEILKEFNKTLIATSRGVNCNNGI